ncbi:hypothetical protein ABE10_01740, partial [Bacillus toyonensis]|nr:hypothetical protein [Bacillus toyonensis]
RDEAGEDDGQTAEALEEGVGAFDVLLAEQSGLFAFEDRGSALVADDVSDLAADEGRERDEQGDDPDVHSEHVVRVGQQPRDDQEGVAGQEEADEETGLREDDEADDEQSPGAGGADDGLRVEPGYESGVVHRIPVG